MYTFEQLITICNTEINKINFISHKPYSLYEPILYTLNNSGKRLRPVSLLLSANLFSKEISKAIKPAMAIEMFHNFTLLHDDIMDNAPTRRGKACVHKKWDENQAILSGDTMSLYAYKLLSESDAELIPRLLTIFNKITIEVCEGQQYDVEFEARNNVTINEYLEMIRLKTSVLLAGAMKMGAICGGASDKESDLIYNIGENLGLAFQIQDDILDTYSDSESFGKTIGGDIIEKKKTFLLLTLKEHSEKEYLEVINIADSKIKTAQKIEAVKYIYDSFGVKEIAEAKIIDLYKKSLLTIDSLDINEESKSSLREFADVILTRKK